MTNEKSQKGSGWTALEDPTVIFMSSVSMKLTITPDKIWKGAVWLTKAKMATIKCFAHWFLSGCSEVFKSRDHFNCWPLQTLTAEIWWQFTIWCNLELLMNTNESFFILFTMKRKNVISVDASSISSKYLTKNYCEIKMFYKCLREAG